MGKGQRYHSIMLVGEHGRVIPFRRFKAVAIAVTALALFSTLALGALGLLYFLQGQMVERLQSELDGLQHQVRVLKDEKDVLKAQLVIRSLQKNTEPAAAAAESKPAPEEKPVQQAIQTKKAAAAEPSPRHQPTIHWRADIRQFENKYDAKAQSFNTRFRIYNTSMPKKPLSGRIVLAFKANGDPPIKWMSVPSVPFVDGKPSGRSGRAFSVRNFRTVEFKTDRLKTPVTFNSVGIYVYSSTGELLLTRDFDFKMPSPPPAATALTPSSAVGARKPAGQAISRPAAPQASTSAAPSVSTPTGPPVSTPAGPPVSTPVSPSGAKETQVPSVPSKEDGKALKNGADQPKPPEPEKVGSAPDAHHETGAVQESNDNSPTPSAKENGSERR